MTTIGKFELISLDMGYEMVLTAQPDVGHT